MRITAIHPAHEFEVVKGLPPFPSLTAVPYETVKCKHCGISALRRRGDAFLTFSGSGQVSSDLLRIRFCITATDDRYGVLHAKITTHNLPARGDHFAHLECGTLHRVVPPPQDDSGRLRGVWVAGPQGPVKVLEGEFLPIKIRDRSRARNTAA